MSRRVWPALSAVLLFVAFPPFHLVLPSLVALVPALLFVVGSEPGRADSSLRGGWWFGVLYFGLILHWVPVALAPLSLVLAVPAFAGQLVIAGAFGSAVFWTLHKAIHAAGLPPWLALGVVWTAGEWLAAHLPFGLAFPWLGLGTSLTGFPELVGIAEWVGARGVTLQLALANGLIATAILARRSGRRGTGAAAAVILLLAIPAGWGIWRARTLELRPAVTLALVQTNVSWDIGRAPDSTSALTLAAAAGLLPAIPPGSVDLVVLPEGALPVQLDLRPDLLEDLAAVGREVGAPVLVGGLGSPGEGLGVITGPSADESSGPAHNSAFMIGPGGDVVFRYDKRHLVPLAERTVVPGLSAEGAARLGGLLPGGAWRLAEVGEARLGVLICFESSFPGVARTYRRMGADFLVNLTNDGWFARRPWHARLGGAWQHPAHLVMRAVETRTGVARAATSGISGFVDPVGRSYGTVELLERGVTVGEVLTSDVVTGYVRVGDLAGSGSAILTLLILVWVGWRGRVRAGPSPAPGSTPHQGREGPG